MRRAVFIIPISSHSISVRESKSGAIEKKKNEMLDR